MATLGCIVYALEKDASIHPLVQTIVKLPCVHTVGAAILSCKSVKKKERSHADLFIITLFQHS